MKTTVHYLKPQTSTALLSMILIFVLSIFTFSCSNEEVMPQDNLVEKSSIVDILKNYESSPVGSLKSNEKIEKKPTFKTLSVALAKTNLAGTVSSNHLTVFACWRDD